MTDYQTQFDKYYTAALDLLKSGASTDQVFQYVDAVEDEDYRNGTLEKVACFFAAQGQVEEAKRFCSAIHNPLEYADALFEVGRELRKRNSRDAAKGIFRKAVEAAGAIKPGSCEMPAILLQVSDELWKLGEKQEAMELLRRSIELAKRPPQHFEASKTLAGCARVLSRWGNASEAIEVAQAIESPEQRRTVLGELQKPSAGS